MIALCSGLLILLLPIAPVIQEAYSPPLGILFSNIHEGQTISGSYKIEVAASDESLVSNIILYIDGEFFKKENHPPYEYVIELDDGQYELRAVATDTSGNENAAISTINVDIQNQEPGTTSGNTDHSPLLIKVVTIRKGEGTLAVISSHLNSEDYVNNFRIQVLDLFPVQQHILNEASIPDIRHAIDSEIPESGVKVDFIMYDNEGWSKTPPEEKEDPGGSTNKAADIVHDAGYSFAVSPDRRTLLKELESVDWQKVELLTIQSQKLVGKPDFKSIVEKASNEVSSENPDTAIFAQVNPSLHTIDQIVAAVDSVRSSIDGVSIIWQEDDETVLGDLLAALGR